MKCRTEIFEMPIVSVRIYVEQLIGEQVSNNLLNVLAPVLYFMVTCWFLHICKSAVIDALKVTCPTTKAKMFSSDQS